MNNTNQHNKKLFEFMEESKTVIIRLRSLRIAAILVEIVLISIIVFTILQFFASQNEFYAALFFVLIFFVFIIPLMYSTHYKRLLFSKLKKYFPEVTDFNPKVVEIKDLQNSFFYNSNTFHSQNNITIQLFNNKFSYGEASFYDNDGVGESYDLNFYGLYYSSSTKYSKETVTQLLIDKLPEFSERPDKAKIEVYNSKFYIFLPSNQQHFRLGFFQPNITKRIIADFKDLAKIVNNSVIIYNALNNQLDLQNQ